MVLILLLVVLLAPTAAWAQHEQHTTSPPPQGWSTSAAAQAFVTLNLQQRKFNDVSQVESTNWVMGRVVRRSSRTKVTFIGMASAEPFTLRRLGSAQVFQAGETLDDLPLRDYQHPHDLVMALTGRLDWQLNARHSVFATAGPVGSPALGPTAFMHRPSALLHPTAPLSHHMLDSTHITHGVITVGATIGAWTVDASAFHGREPDEDRVGLDLGPIDSVSGRLSWRSGAWHAQVSGALVNEPERLEPGDTSKITASVEYVAPDGSDPTAWAWTAAIGRNGRSDHDEWGGLIEAVRRLTPRWRAYSRAELVDRFILVDFEHAIRTGRERHLLSRVGALTVGLERSLSHGPLGQLATGIDVTVHHTPRNLRDSYGRPVSAHLYLRWNR